MFIILKISDTEMKTVMMHYRHTSRSHWLRPYVTPHILVRIFCQGVAFVALSKVMLMLVLMMFLEPMLLCANEPNWPTDDCSHVTPVSSFSSAAFSRVYRSQHIFFVIRISSA